MLILKKIIKTWELYFIGEDFVSVQDELSLQKVVIFPKKNKQLNVHTSGGQQLQKTTSCQRRYLVSL